MLGYVRVMDFKAAHCCWRFAGERFATPSKSRRATPCGDHLLTEQEVLSFPRQVAEGLDFADERARAVLVVGVPYPPAKDAQETLPRGPSGTCFGFVCVFVRGLMGSRAPTGCA
jgi:hypothetical protein